MLDRAGIPCTIRVPSVAEVRREGETPRDYVRRLAREKALAIGRSEDEIVLGADTVVVLDGSILEKPADAAEAARMLRRLSGRRHTVITGFYLAAQDAEASGEEETAVVFEPLDDRQIEEYASTSEPLDKAGAYAIQGIASRYIPRIDGCYHNVAGLPVARVYEALLRLGWRSDL